MAGDATDSSDEETQDELFEDDMPIVHLTSSKRFEGIRTLTSDGLSHALYANIKALLVTAVLFTFITVVQMFAARMANSQALLMDCISMGVDALTYLGNVLVEYRKLDGGEHVPLQLIVCAVSLSFLCYFTYDAATESWATARICNGWDASMEDDESVNGWITLTFALGGVVFDLISLYAFRESKKQSGSERHINMYTALLHVGADFLRSSSTLIMSLLILLGGFDSTCLDAYISLFIGASILCGALAGLTSWLKLAHAHYCRSSIRRRTYIHPGDDI